MTDSPTPQNETLFQSFEWHTPGNHYQRISRALPSLAHIGITSIWLPPGCKANNPHGNGYDCYDLWDLGEFEQKGTRSTKWGSKGDLDHLISQAKELQVGVIWDAVLNHKTAGDATEECWAVEVDPEDRTVETGEPHQIEPWIQYNFPGRGDHYSGFKWHWWHFNGTDWDQRGQNNAIFKIVDPPDKKTDDTHRKGWAEDVDDENGNADYLMFTNIDYSDQDVRDEVIRWGKWMINDIGVDGFRLDAVQHYSWRFAKEWASQIQAGRSIFVVGEFWTGDVEKILDWTDFMGEHVRAFDAPLVWNFAHISMPPRRKSNSRRRSSAGPDLRQVFRGSLVEERPDQAVTVVMNHDTQPGQTVDTPIAPFFKPLAYALILLRAQGQPCVFFGDLYGLRGPSPQGPSCDGLLPKLLLARKLYAYGEQHDHFDSRTSIGWTRRGTWDRPDGCAVVMSIAGAAHQRMAVGEMHAGEIWTDLLGLQAEEVHIDASGHGIFACQAQSVGVFVSRAAAHRQEGERVFNLDIYDR